MTSLVTFNRATLGYGRRAVLTDISFDIPEGDFLGLVGPNGAGKTTILRALLGSLTPLSGSVTRSPTLRFGYVPQRDQVDYNFPLKVLDVVLMGRYDRIGLGRRPTAADRRLANERSVSRFRRRFFRRIEHYPSVVQLDRSKFGASHHLEVVRCHDYRRSAVVDVLEQLEYSARGALVEIPSRLVSENEIRLIHKRSRDCDALLLTPGKLARQLSRF